MSSISWVDIRRGVWYSKHMEQMTFAERLRAIRQGRLIRTGPEISIRELARRTGISNATISQIENGKTWAGKMPPGDDVRKLADGLGVTVAQLSGDIDQAPSPAVREVVIPHDPETERLAEIGRQVLQVVQRQAPFIVPSEQVEYVDDTNEPMVELPIFDSFAASHLGSSGRQVQDRIKVPERIAVMARRPLVIQVTGDCLALRGIITGDFIVVDAENKTPREGQIVAFRFRDEDSVKVFQRDGDMLCFVPTLDRYPTIRVRPDEMDELEIVGVSVGAVRAAPAG